MVWHYESHITMVVGIDVHVTTPGLYHITQYGGDYFRDSQPYVVAYR